MIVASIPPRRTDSWQSRATSELLLVAIAIINHRIAVDVERMNYVCAHNSNQRTSAAKRQHAEAANKRTAAARTYQILIKPTLYAFIRLSAYLQ